MIHKAHSIQIKPTKSQKELLHKSFGCARHSYNWALGVWKKQYSRGKKPKATSLIKLQNSIKKKAMPFYLEVSKTAPQYAIWDLESAFKKFWNEGAGYPKFKKKGSKDSFVAVESSAQFKKKDRKLWLPRIGWVKCSEDLRFEGKVNNVVVKRIADKYFAVVNIITNETPPICENQAVVGVDLGIKELLVCSDGKVFKNPRALKSNLKNLKRLQRSLQRKQKGSKNRKKQQIKVARKHYKISCMRKNAIHTATSYLVSNYGKIVVEGLNVKGMLKNRKLSQALTDTSFGEVVRQLTYKCKWSGVELIKADQWFPSSKICSGCGNKKQILKLSERTYNCENCGLTIDRDLNAAINLANYSPTQENCGSEACGERSESEKIQRTSVKQEVDINIVQNARNIKNL